MKITIGKKVSGGFIALTVIYSIITFVLFYFTTENSKSVEFTRYLLSEATELILVEEEVNLIWQYLNDVELTKNKNVFSNEVLNAKKNISSNIDRLLELNKNDKEYNKKLLNLVTETDEMISLGRKMHEAYRVSKEEGNKFMYEFDTKAQSILNFLTHLISSKLKKGNEEINQVHDNNTKINTIMVLVFILFVSLSTFISYKITMAVKMPIVNLKEAAEKVKNGDYTFVDIKTGDELEELGNSFNAMTETLEVRLSYLDKLPAPIMIVDNEFNIQYMNKKGSEILDESQSDLIGQKCSDKFKTGDCNTDKCACGNAIKFDNVFTSETECNPHGTKIPIMYTGAPIKNKKGEIIGAIEYVADVSELKEREDYLKRATANILTEMDKFANGDLTVKVIPEKEGDDIAKLFNGFNIAVEKIRNLVAGLKDAVEATASASTQISSSAEEMAAGAEEQSAQTSEIATAIDQMATTILDTTRSTNEAAEAAKRSGQIAEQGGKSVQNTIDGINKIASVVDQTAVTVEALGESSNKIGEITQVIDDIADQTNLLALNAAIEAARAGEQGRGFAVVADEVRKLAERTTKATKEIGDMIKKIQYDTRNAVDSIRNGKNETEKGMQLASEARAALNEIIRSSQTVMDVINQVATASEEQSATAEEISKNIESINNVAQESAAGVQQIARASEDLNQLTENLQNMIEQFRITSENMIYENERRFLTN